MHHNHLLHTKSNHKFSFKIHLYNLYIKYIKYRTFYKSVDYKKQQLYNVHVLNL